MKMENKYIRIVANDGSHISFNDKDENVSDIKIMDERIVIKFTEHNRLWEQVILFPSIKFYESNVMK